MWEKWGWGGGFIEEMIFVQFEGRVNICQIWKVMEEEGSIKNSNICSDLVGIVGRSEQWCMDGRLRKIVIKGVIFSYRRVRS